jgi:uncharacterized protein (DUF885 family)
MDEERQIAGWWRCALTSLLLTGVAALFLRADRPASFDELVTVFTSEYAALSLEPFVLALESRLESVPEKEVLIEQQEFFSQWRKRLDRYNERTLNDAQKQQLRLIDYIMQRQQERIHLELAWHGSGRPMPARGMEGLPYRQRWYEWLVERYTSTKITPREVKELGEREITRCHNELAALAMELGFTDEASFHAKLRSEEFLIRDREVLFAHFARIDSITRARLPLFAEVDDVPKLIAMEWPDAGPRTPPAHYIPREQGDLENDVFQLNFHQNSFNSRALGWIYLHEGIPGHHLQRSIERTLDIKDLHAHIAEFGNREGWACYVEYHGEILGVYNDPWQRVGKWEWDLVRSVRLVLDVGIHYEGWSREQALEFWKANITGQDEIAEREVDRVTNWPAQALGYKVGADKIERIAESIREKQGGELDMPAFHRAFLNAGELPLALMEEHIALELGVG